MSGSLFTSTSLHYPSLSLPPSCLSLPPAPFDTSNSSLDYLRGTLGRSYMCREEQTLAVTVNFSLNTFQLQVQPFGLTGDQFGAGTVGYHFMWYYGLPFNVSGEDLFQSQKCG